MFRIEQRCRDQNIPAIKEHRCTVYTVQQQSCIGLKLIESSLQEEATKRWLHLEQMGNHAEMRQHLDRMSALTGCDDSKNMETIYWTCGGVANMVNIIIVRLNSMDWDDH